MKLKKEYLEKVYEVQYTNGEYRFSHLHHTLESADREADNLKENGCTEISITVYKTTKVASFTTEKIEV